jgi:hypothetical protein
MNRRNFLSSGTVIAIAAPFMATKAIVDLTREKQKPLPELKSGQILTAQFMNELVDRINELENRV